MKKFVHALALAGYILWVFVFFTVFLLGISAALFFCGGVLAEAGHILLAIPLWLAGVFWIIVAISLDDTFDIMDKLITGGPKDGSQ